MATLPYLAEYAKSGKASCKGCKNLIEKQSLRLAIMVQSSFFDGMQPNWFHPTCFFTRARPKNTDDIAHFQNLRWNDQEDVRKRIEGATGNVVEPKSKGKGKSRKRAVSTDPSLPSDINDYTIEYAKSGRAKCKVCEENILKNEVRISKKDYESEAAKKYGPVERWHHVKCFLVARNELEFFASGKIIPGFKNLNADDQEMIDKQITETKSNGSAAAKKLKVEEPSADMDKMKEQNEAFFKIRDNLAALSKKELTALLEYNKEDIPSGVESILDRLADLMTFGNLPKCSKCTTGALVFKSGVGYQCKGYMSEWSKCAEIVNEPKRTAFKIPKDLKKEYAFLSSYKPVMQNRLFVKKEIKEPEKISTERLLLTGLKFVLHKIENPDVKIQIKKFGGEILKYFDENLAAVVTVPSELSRKKPLKIITSAKDADIPCIEETFFNNLTPTSSRDDVVKHFKESICSSWGSESILNTKLAYDTVDGGKSIYKSKSASSSKSMFKSDMGVQKFTIKDGLIVDPESKLEKKAHVYKSSPNDIYSVVLSLTDLTSGKNSFYKLQVLESDKKSKYWLFRSWGRIGTTIGGNKTEQYATLSDAIEIFENLFEEKTGNEWSRRNKFQKIGGKMMMLDVVQGADTMSKLTVDENSNLEKPVQELMTLIFDIEAMKKTMMEFEIDLQKMPLGKISKKQISSAFSLLTELQQLRSSNASKSEIVDKTNRFYTLVPHNFGIENPPILDNDDLIAQKIDMLNNLLDIEIAYSLLEQNSTNSSNESPIDLHYKKLNANITVLDKTTEEFKNIEMYVQNTHADTHTNYSLIIDQVFKIERQGEAQRYKKFDKLDNKMLLWHGSRITNYAGILSQGLRIAPKEAPVTGYMFGKGIYFADMVSKSANYCMTTSQNTTGLLLLCEVALGKMHERKVGSDAKLPKGKNSVKGVGRTHPDPQVTGKTASGAVIPYGKPKAAPVKNTQLLYNEFIVYDVNQVQINYCIRMKFNYGKK